jgi:hypothetical protein
MLKKFLLVSAVIGVYIFQIWLSARYLNDEIIKYGFVTIASLVMSRKITRIMDAPEFPHHA